MESINCKILIVSSIWCIIAGIHADLTQADDQNDSHQRPSIHFLQSTATSELVTTKLSLLARHLNVDYGLGKIRPKQVIDDQYKLQAFNVSLMTQRRLLGLQFPSNCSSPKLLLCKVPPHGLGSVTHHLAYCLIFGYALNRTVIFDWSEFRYKVQWNDYYYPLTNCTATPAMIDQAVSYDYTWLSKDLTKIDYKIISFPFGYVIHRQYDYMVPADLVDDILPWCDDPALWWHSLVMRYVLLPRPITRSLIWKVHKRIKQLPDIAGIHIRHTDKLFKEAKHYPLQDYLKIADTYFQSLTSNNNSTESSKAIYLATDNTTVVQQSHSYRDQYNILNDLNATTLAEGSYYGSPRYSDKGFETALIDIYLLAATNYTIVTMSSNIGRLAYEIKKFYNWRDISHSVYSMDEAYHLFGCDPNQIHHGQRAVHIAIKACQAKDESREISLKPGDLIYYEQLGMIKDQYYGYSKTLQRHGNYPAECVRIATKIYDYPTYEQFTNNLIDRVQLYT